MRAQIEWVGKNFQACLEAAGASASDVILMRAYVTDTDAFAKNADRFNSRSADLIPCSAAIISLFERIISLFGRIGNLSCGSVVEQ
jgi:enamine deaminase RidA (YjgF/YER057c/UK114 family)